MTRPRATYRMQFRGGTTFDSAAALIPYLADLGISHLYASPILAAAPGSTHGYDGIDFAAMEPAIGGEDGFDRLDAALNAAGLGLLLDFVPNHMAASESNGWWRSVLEWGEKSPHAAAFDIDWTAPKLMLPILGQHFEDALADGDVCMTFNAATGVIGFGVYDRVLPLNPPSCAMVLVNADESAIRDLAASFAAATPENTAVLRRHLADIACDPHARAAIERAVLAVDAEGLQQIHEAQIWRLAFWREGRHSLTYRRFFEIADLVCLHVENPAVFDAVHSRLLDLIAQGRVDGVRIDHIDGLADPKRYLERLQSAVRRETPLYLVVEKIVEPGETLRPDWPIDGTTGYEAIAALAGLFVDREQEAAMTDAWRNFTEETEDFETAARAAKRDILTHNLEAELNTLVGLARMADMSDEDALRRAIVELTAAFPVYRSYVAATGPDEADRKLIERATEAALEAAEGADRTTIGRIARLLLLDTENGAARDAALAFATRFQQTSGPVMAKAVEDTLFYRYNRLIALNEVGGDPARYGAPADAFHATMADRQMTQPAGLFATATHDTKRGEDARARLYALSEMPQRWAAAVARWSDMTAQWRTTQPAGPAPDRQTEWLFYQALLGAWPLDRPDENKLGAVRDRMRAYMGKAIREAKTRTSWTEPDAGYEEAVDGFVTAALTPSADNRFLDDFAESCAPILVAGVVTSLSQLAVKLAAPGVPDFYQGTELWDFSLVDPDNRAPVDFGVRANFLDKLTGAAPGELIAGWRTGMPKIALMRAGLRLRQSDPALFADGAYVALHATGSRARHIVAFGRHIEGRWTIVIVPRFNLALTDGRDRPAIPLERWEDTAIVLPSALRERPLLNVLTGKTVSDPATIAAADALSEFPVALLVADSPDTAALDALHSFATHHAII